MAKRSERREWGGKVIDVRDTGRVERRTKRRVEEAARGKYAISEATRPGDGDVERSAEGRLLRGCEIEGGGQSEDVDWPVLAEARSAGERRTGGICRGGSAGPGEMGGRLLVSDIFEDLNDGMLTKATGEEILDLLEECLERTFDRSERQGETLFKKCAVERLTRAWRRRGGISSVTTAVACSLFLF